ncbi:hypothetical protein BOX17_11670 [Halomonas aestuarii]|uniref:Phage coat protein n=1 Tax=Halomonas aestuarii TaxID=1897729 RepID=A0A1J0VHQ7_9GAMM|nr:major coat protein [Halomonas aestuarii]APE31546.1 hypothetical protein BOX17_11670 [Halomonas aestuarii]
MKSALRKLGHAARNRYTQAGAGITALVVAGTANATEPTAAEAAFTALQSEADAMAGYAWPVVAGIVGSLLAIGLFKKFANKAT